MKQIKKYIIHFNQNTQFDPLLKGWIILENPNSREIWSDTEEKFENAEVVFILTGDAEYRTTLPAAKQILTVSPKVKLLKVKATVIIDETTLASAKIIPTALVDINQDDIIKLTQIESNQPLHPAQDYVNGIFYYGSIIQGEEYLVPSKDEMFPLSACSERGISLLQLTIHTSKFSHKGVLEHSTDSSIIDPESIFNEISAYIKKHIYFSNPETYDLISVWIMGTYIFRAFRYYPYLHLNAEKGSGKTLLMELMAPIAFNGMLMTQPVASTVLKLIEQNSATLFIDEAENLSGRGSPNGNQLKQILKTGFARSGVYYQGDSLYRTFSPKCFAGINELDDVLADRTITVKMLRKIGYDTMELFRETPLMNQFQSQLRDKLYIFGLHHGPSIAERYESKTPVYDKLQHLTNRAYDVWLPLFMIVNSFPEGNVKTQAFQSLDHLSQADSKRRRLRDNEENETGSLIAMLTEVLPQLKPLDSIEGIDYYDPDGLHLALQRAELIPKSMQKKALSRMLKRVLEIDSIPRAYLLTTKRMYAIDKIKYEEYKKRYSDIIPG